MFRLEMPHLPMPLLPTLFRRLRENAKHQLTAHIMVRLFLNAD